MLPQRPIPHFTALLGLLLGLMGCGASSNPTNSGTPATIAPYIITQPASLTVPIGLEGIFSVVAGGNGTLTEQWYRNGAAISASDAFSYTTPTVAATDTGSVFTVTISNSLGSVTSQPATLTAGARAPKAGDLRFQQVDSENTVNGYVNNASALHNIPGLGGLLFSNAFGNLMLETNECYFDGCVLFTNAFAQPTGTVPLASGFFADYFPNLETDLTNGYFNVGGLGNGPINGPSTVVTSMELDPVNNVFGMSYTQTSQTGGFDLAQHTISPASLPAAATQEGLSSRIITAISYNAGQITYFSYGWTGDTTTVYETMTSTATFANVGTVASSLAAQGYIITALGGDAADGIIMIGTRVQGDTMARSVLVEPSYSSSDILILTGGYAIVGVANDTATGVWIGER